MKAEVIILKEAENQLMNHFIWLEDQGSNLGLAFHDACEVAFALLLAHPEIAPRFAGHFRRYVMRKWQVGIFYSYEGGRILVHGAWHLRQSPDSIRKALGL